MALTDPMTNTDRPFIPALRYKALTPFYDLFQRLFVRDGRFKQPLIQQARLQPRHRVLEIGCGTGRLAIMAKRSQPQAEVIGLDADPQILEIARKNAAQQSLQIQFDQGMADQLPYPDASLDRVLSSLMYHHLDTPAKHRAAAEIHRVLRPGGELHLVDFGRPVGTYARLVSVLLRGFEEVDDNLAGHLPAIFAEADLKVEETGHLTTFFGSLSFLAAVKAPA